VAGTSSSDPGSVTDVNGTKFFGADDGEHGWELWKSDGTASGSTLVKDISPGGFYAYGYGYQTGSSSLGNMTNFAGRLVFTASNSLWTSDGTGAGTGVLSSLFRNPDDLTVVNGTLFFTAYDDTNGQELWKTDGTVAGTTIVKDIVPGGIVDNYGLFRPYG